MACDWGDCFGVDEQGRPQPVVWPTANPRYPTSVAVNGLTCRTHNGKKGLYVTPDAGVNTFRQVRKIAITGPMDGPPISSFVLNSGNSGTALINTRNGGPTIPSEWQFSPRGAKCGAVLLKNFSNARTWIFNVVEYIHMNATITAGGRASFNLDTSYNYSTWTPRIQTAIDNRGVSSTRSEVMFMTTSTLIHLPPGGTQTLDTLIRCFRDAGTITLTGLQIYADVNVMAVY